jgi:TonB family protein
MTAFLKSGVLHLLVFSIVFLYAPTSNTVEPVKYVSVVLTPPDSKNRRIVKVDPKTNNQSPNNSIKTHLANSNQNADINTISPKTGSFKNDANGGPEVDEHGFFKATKSILTKGTGENSTEIYFPDAIIGVKTLINAEKFKFTSFYDRIRKKVVPHWIPLITKESNKQKSSKEGLPVGIYTTHLNVIIAENGHISTIFVAKSSGYPKFDQLAVRAFRASEPLENPPVEMLKEGFVTITWEFVLKVDPLTVKVI